MEQANFKLRHSIEPYIGLPVIFGIIGIFAAYIGFTKNDWGGFISILVAFVLLFIATVIFGLRYRIWLTANTIHMQTSTWNNRRNITSINISEISSIANETSDMHTLAKLGRPFRRIAVYDQKHQKYIDISLKHFVRSDIKKLLQEIHKQRPDISIPAN